MNQPKIKRIEIAGYKSIRSLALDLGQINVLVGANGSGKSNFLSFFSLLQNLAIKKLQNFILASGGGNRLLHFGAKTTPIIAATVVSDAATSVGVGYELALAHAAGDTLFFTLDNIKHLAEGKMMPSPGQSRESAWGKSSGESEIPIIQLMQKLSVFHFHDTSSTANIRNACDIEDYYPLRPNGGNLAAVLYRLQKTNYASMEAVVAAIQQVAPFFHGFALNPPTTKQKTINLRWRDSGSDEDFGTHYLSDGTLRFIALATLLLQPPDDLPPVIILDEPELGLHPYAITLLAAMIHRAAEHRQVILATQSIELLNHFEPEDVVVVDRQDRSTEFRRLDREQLSVWLEDYTLGELWDKNVFGGGPFHWQR